MASSNRIHITSCGVIVLHTEDGPLQIELSIQNTHMLAVRRRRPYKEVGTHPILPHDTYIQRSR